MNGYFVCANHNCSLKNIRKLLTVTPFANRSDILVQVK